jgi:hypothetical protein
LSRLVSFSRRLPTVTSWSRFFFALAGNLGR